MPADRRITDLFGIQLPVIQAPMAGSSTPDMAVAVAEAGGLGSLPSAQYAVPQLREAILGIKARTSRPLNVNFFCHVPPADDPAAQAAWRARLQPFYDAAGLGDLVPPAGPGRAPFDDAFCAVVEELRPEVASFHFGLPAPDLLERVRRTGARILSSATTVREAVWLESQGVDAVIAMGAEAGGHRGNFLTHDMAGQVGTMALVPQVVDAVSVPVIAAGGIADRRGVAAAFALGASAVQVGTAYLFTREANVNALYRAALEGAAGDDTALTNLFTGRPARGILNRLMREVGPLSTLAPAFPTAGGMLAPLRQAAEAKGAADFTNLWAGQAVAVSRIASAADLTGELAAGVPD